MHRTARPSTVRSLALLGGVLVALTGCDATGSPDPSTPATTTPSASAAASASPSAATDSGSASPTPGATDVGTDPGAEPTAAPTSAPVGVEVTVTFAGWNATTSSVEVGGYVTGVLENGGTCTLRLVRDAASVEVAGPAYADAASTTCEALAVRADRVTSGSWSAQLTYRSATTTGTSTTTEVVVP